MPFFSNDFANWEIYDCLDLSIANNNLNSK